MNPEELFISVGFDGEYRKSMSEFYGNYFDSEDAMTSFFVKVFEEDNISKLPRQMMNQVEHFVSLANDIEKIRPYRDSLQILFIKTCLEALCHLSNKKKTNFYSDFPDCFSKEGKEYILNNFSLSYFDDKINGHQFEAVYDMTIHDFFEIVKTVRDIVVHEGTYWDMHFFAYDKDSTWLTSLTTDEKIFKLYEYQCKNKMVRTYHFETKLQYDKFIFYFVKACIYFIVDYVNRMGVTA